MGQKAKPLSALEVDRITKRGVYAVGGVSGLSLQVTESGSRSWVLRATVGRKRRVIGLGGYPDVTLSQAKDKARNTRNLILEGIDPVEQRRQAKQELIAAQHRSMTFAKATEQKHKAISKSFKSKVHSDNWFRSLEKYAFPIIGDMDVAKIELPDILAVLEPIWQTKTETATRVRLRMEAVLAWSIVRGHRQGNNPATWQGNLKEVLPPPEKLAKRKHFRALHWRDIPDFMPELSQRGGVSARALEFTILTAARSGEVRGMTWAELDMDAGTWTVSAKRMKADKKHVVPLSKEALEIVKNQPHMLGSGFVFPSTQGGQLSNMALLAVCKRMDIDAVPHGFRSSFKDWARNATDYPDEVSELALAHVNNNATRAAYARDGLLGKRAKLMQAWANYCYTPQQEVAGKIKDAA